MPAMPAASGAARGAMTKNDPVPKRTIRDGAAEAAPSREASDQKRPRPQTHKRTIRDGAAEAAPSRDASNYALGSCCVMQWMLPPP